MNLGDFQTTLGFWFCDVPLLTKD